jgi:membrane protein YqaA with SNARE-associated domain
MGSSRKATDTAAPPAPDDLRLRYWTAVYFAWLAALAIPAAVLLARAEVPWSLLFSDPAAVARSAGPVLKLLLFAFYISICLTVLPLPTGAMVSAVALRQVAPTERLWTTVLLVATVGAAASMMANLFDFLVFRGLLRRPKVARVRRGRLYRRLADWFDRQPFLILTVFAMIPLPADVPIRMLAATRHYPLAAYAGASFAGRWVRYAVLAGVTFALGERGWVAVVVLLAVGGVTALARSAWRLYLRFGNGANRRESGDVETEEAA